MYSHSAIALRLEIEHKLEQSFPAALTPARPALRETASIGIAELDFMLAGGLPIGAISEVNGPASSGRTSLVLSFLAQRSAEGEVCAWIDVGDAFVPESAAANGVNLRQLLWVRCTGNEASAKRKEATKPWTKLDQALRATDLLLQAGGFAAIVLDMGDTSAEHTSRIPLATWFRFRQAANRTRTCLVLLAQAGAKQSIAQSSAAIVLECSMLSPMIVGGAILNGFHFEVRSERQRLTQFDVRQKKPPVSAWLTTCAWYVAQARMTEKSA
jgi:hypothetical protein